MVFARYLAIGLHASQVNLALFRVTGVQLKFAQDTIRQFAERDERLLLAAGGSERIGPSERVEEVSVLRHDERLSESPDSSAKRVFC